MGPLLALPEGCYHINYFRDGGVLYRSPNGLDHCCCLFAVKSTVAHQVESDHCDFWSPPVLKTGRGTSRAQTCTHDDRVKLDMLFTRTKHTERGARTLDHQVKSLTLYRLS